MNTKRASSVALVLYVLAAVLAAGNNNAPAATSIELTVVERSGVARQKEPVTSGVPLPKGELRSAAHARLLRDGREVAAQIRAAGWWRPGDSIRWLLVDFQTDLEENARQTYKLEYGDEVSATAKPAQGVHIEESDAGYVVDTGAARFEVNKKALDLFHEVRLADGTVIVPRPSAAEPRFGAVLRGVRPMVTRAIPGPANKGRSHLVYVVCSPTAGLEDYTLRFLSPRQYEVVGAKSGPVGQGAYLKDFTSKDGLVSIPAGAWLNYAFPEQGDVYQFRTVSDGSSAVSENIWEATVLERGPMRSVIRLKGSFGPGIAPVLEFTAWYHFYAGSERGTVSVADFWQNYPKALAADPDGAIEIGLFPAQYASDFPLRSGEHKTHEVLFWFHPGAALEEGSQSVARAFSDPLRLEPSPQWFAGTRALGDLHPFDMENYRAYEVRNLSAIGIFPEGQPPGPSLLSRREENEFHGWMDYGDVPMDFEAPSGQWGMKYGIFYTITPQPDGGVTGSGECSHYNIMAADLLALAHRLTGRAEFLDGARRCFAYGVKNANGKNGGLAYFQVHSANGAMHGNLFMVLDSAARNR